MITGFQNEYEFVKYLNGKKVEELNPLFYELIVNLFGEVDGNCVITSWLNQYPQKADFFIKIGGYVRSVSLKMGMKNSVHVERISDFVHFLIENKVPRDCIMSYLQYHYADGTFNGTGNVRLSSAQYKIEHQSSIDEMNIFFNNEELLCNAIDRFVLKGKNSKYSIDAIICGEVNDFVWLLRDDIKKVILSKKNLYSTSVHFGSLVCQPKARCLNHNPKYEKDRFCVQIKWYSLFDDIIMSMNNEIVKWVENMKSIDEFLAEDS